MSVSSYLQHHNTLSEIFYYWLLRLQNYCCVQINSVLLSSSWSSMLAVINKIHWRVGVCVINCTVDRHNCWSHCCSHQSDSHRDFCLPHLHSTPSLGESPSKYCNVWYGKTRMVWLYRMVKKIWRHVYSFPQNTWTWRTDGQTPRGGIGRAHAIASRGKKTKVR